MIEGLQISIPQRMKILRVTLILSLLISMLLSWPLWGGERSFPYTPLWFSFRIAPPFDFVYLFLIIVLCMASLFLVKQRLLLFLAILFCAWLAVCDITRLQPWFYIYNALLLILVFYDGRVDDSNKFTSYFILLQIIVASVYFFCGINQMNPDFVEYELAPILSPLRNWMSERQFQLFMKMGAASPYMLAGLGIGLMIPAIRFLAVTLGILMHFFLALFLFPSSTNSNYALWFSNLAFMIVLFLLFSGKTKQRYFSPTFLFQTPLSYAVFFLFVIAPILNQTGNWPDFLSFNFKSGNNRAARIVISNKVLEKLPSHEKQFVVFSEGVFEMDYRAWCLKELHAECFPDRKVFNSIFSRMADLNGGDVKEIELKQIAGPRLLRKP